MSETTKTTKAVAKACACSTAVDTCSSMTKGVFAPGHDAKLVSVAVRATVGGTNEVVPGSWLDAAACSDDDIVERMSATAREFTVRFGPALANKYHTAADNAWQAQTSKDTRAEARRAAKADRGAARAEALIAKLAATPDPKADDPSQPIVIMQPALIDLIAAVREHAQQNYEEAGWDAVVEAWSDDEIANTIGRARTAKTAIARVGKVAKMASDYADEIRKA